MTEVGIATRDQMGQVFNLRYQTLREPLGEPRGSERDEFDHPSIHHRTTVHGIATDGELVVATGRIHRLPDNPTEAQVRYMATAPRYRGQGLGASVLETMEEIALMRMDLKAINLNAREQAVPLYTRAGYEPVSDVIEIHGLPHIPMRKSL